MLPDPCHTYICYCVIQSVLPLHYRHCLGRRLSTWLTRSIWKMLGPFATTSRLTPIHQVSPLYCRTPPVHRCPQRRRRQRQRVTEGTAMAPWNGPKDNISERMTINFASWFVHHCAEDGGRYAARHRPQDDARLPRWRRTSCRGWWSCRVLHLNQSTAAKCTYTVAQTTSNFFILSK